MTNTCKTDKDRPIAYTLQDQSLAVRLSTGWEVHGRWEVRKSLEQLYRIIAFNPYSEFDGCRPGTAPDTGCFGWSVHLRTDECEGTGSLYTLRRSGPIQKLGFTISLQILFVSGANANRHKPLVHQAASLKRKTASTALLGLDQD